LPFRIGWQAEGQSIVYPHSDSDYAPRLQPAKHILGYLRPAPGVRRAPGAICASHSALASASGAGKRAERSTCDGGDDPDRTSRRLGDLVPQRRSFAWHTARGTPPAGVLAQTSVPIPVVTLQAHVRGVLEV
jgi:hypothetical protein